ncbi:MAG: glycosyltransferase [Planctomycetes bacterium]|nr:glycosyltransferase [Planctomycetota bacterium]
MKILHYLPSLSLTRGGPVRAVVDLTGGFASRGHDVTLLTCDRGDAPASWDGKTPGKPRLIVLPPPEVDNKPFARSHMRTVRECAAAAEIVHVHGVWNYCNAQLARMAYAQHKPYLVSLRGMLDDWSVAQKAFKKRFFHWVYVKKHLERAAAVHCTAQAELDQSKKWFPRGHGVVVANLLDLNPFRKPPGPELARQKFPVLANGRPNVLFLSRLHYKKGVEILIQAAHRLRQNGVACNVIFAGTGDPEYASKMQELVGELDIDDYCHFVGHVGGPLKISLYQACDIFALPTSQENFGFVFPEALASGTPIVTTKGVDIWTELQEGGAASIVDRTPEAFAAEIASLLNDSPRLEKMKSAAKPFVFRTYDETLLMDQYEAVYRECMAKRR